MIKYWARDFGQTKIKRVEVVKETPKFVTLVNGGKRKKETDWGGYFEAYLDTWEDAKEWLINRSKNVLDRKEEELRKAQVLVAEMEAIPAHEPNGD